MDPFDGPGTGPHSLLVRLLITLGIGLLIGLEREYAKRVVEKEEPFAGVRTYPLIALLGFLCALLGEQHGPAFLVAGFAGLVAMVVASYVMMARSASFGITTELAGIIAFLLGVLVFADHILLATTITVLVVSLLTLKVRLRTFIATLSPADIRAFIQFTIISALVLPFLPRGGIGPGGVWDLQEIWTMVILVTGISLAGYLLVKLFGGRKGTLFEGLIGGLVSSTAVTLSLSRRSRTGPANAQRLAAVGIVAATSVMYPRILLETWVVDRGLALHLLPAILAVTATAVLTATLLWRRADHAPGSGASEPLQVTNPLNFGVALQFGAVYMLVQWLMLLATVHDPAQGLYAAGLLFGATDMDAITLSIARQGELDEARRATAILLATVSNTLMKFALVVVFGERGLRTRVGLGFGAILVATVFALLLG
ncbi:MAG: MgtC/SapB family protein [Flavobacteriales bacterium]|nr:MgtC/SapB family protein [Flavobacteriales bacterium]